MVRPVVVVVVRGPWRVQAERDDRLVTAMMTIRPPYFKCGHDRATSVGRSREGAAITK
jgi:hypothetical protein